MDDSLVSIGRKIYRSLDQIASKDFLVEPDSDTDQNICLIRHEGERFKVWAVSLGLLVPGHGSLDYRVRGAHNLAQSLKSFLCDLLESLEEVLEFDGCTHEADDPAISEGDDELPSDDEDVDVLAIQYESIRDIISRLLRISIKLRNPSTRLRSAKAEQYRIIDNDVDLFNQYAPFDHDYVTAIFQQYRSGSSSGGATKIESGSSSPSLAEHFLVRRIASANVARRRQFAYWRHHRLKLEQLTAFTVRDLSQDEPKRVSNRSTAHITVPMPRNVPPLSISTATQLYSNLLNGIDAESLISVSEYAPNPVVDTDYVPFPPAPILQQSEAFFECPYCLTTCARRTARGAAWKAHLIHDLRPYICTVEGCKTPDQQYDTVADWVQHEVLLHQSAWPAPEKNDQESRISDELQRLSSPQPTMSILSPDDSNGNQVAPSTKARICCICDIELPNEVNMHGHVALHLERLALFSLPRSTHMDQDGDENQSGDANHEGELSREDTLSSSLSFPSRPSERASESDAVVDEVTSTNADLDTVKSSVYEDSQGRLPAGWERRVTLKSPSRTYYVDHNTRTTTWLRPQPVTSEETETHADADIESFYLRRLAQNKAKFGWGFVSDLETVKKLGDLYHNQKTFIKAEQLYNGVLEEYEKIIEIEPDSTVRVMDMLYKLYMEQEKFEEAERMCQRVLDLQKTKLGVVSASTLKTMQNLVAILSKLGKDREAEEMYQEALVSARRELSPEDPYIQNVMRGIAKALIRQKKWREAEVMLLQLVEILRSSPGAEDRLTLMSMDDLANVLLLQDKYREAEQIDRNVLELREKTLGLDHLDTLKSMEHLAEMLAAQDKFEEAEDLYRRLLELNESTHRPEHPGTLKVMLDLGSILSHQNKHAEAEQLLRSVLASREKALGLEHPDTLQTMTDLADILKYDQSGFAEAEGLLQRLLVVREKQLELGNPELDAIRRRLATVRASTASLPAVPKATHSNLRPTGTSWN